MSPERTRSTGLRSRSKKPQKHVLGVARRSWSDDPDRGVDIIGKLFTPLSPRLCAELTETAAAIWAVSASAGCVRDDTLAARVGEFGLLEGGPRHGRFTDVFAPHPTSADVCSRSR